MPPPHIRGVKAVTANRLLDHLRGLGLKGVSVGYDTSSRPLRMLRVGGVNFDDSDLVPREWEGYPVVCEIKPD